MVEWQDDEQDFIFVQGNDAAALGHIGRVVTVRQQDAFRIRRRTGCITDIGIVVWTDGRITVHEILPVCRQEAFAHLLDIRHPDLPFLQAVHIEGGIIKHDDPLHGRALADDGADLGELVGGHEDPLGIGMVDTEQEVFPVTQVDGEGHVGRTGIHRSKLGKDPHGTALGKQCDLIPLLHTQRHQAGADTVSLLAGLLLGDFFPYSVHLFPDIDIVRELTAILLDKVDDGRSVIVHRYLCWVRIIQTSARRSCR